MAGRASIVGAAATHVGNVREHNEDAHFLDLDLGVFLVCDGMGGHAAGEVASALAIDSVRQEWASEGLRAVADYWLERGTPEAKKQLLEVVRAGVLAAHGAILAEAGRDEAKTGMGTTLVGAIVVGGELVFAHAGDSRAYLVRDGISMQLTEDHTLLARLLAAGIDVDVSGEGARFRSMLTNALGIGEECKISSFVVPLADGDRFLLCSDGISEYVPENEVGDVLSKQPSPARAAQRLIDLALERGGGDNATAVVMRVLEAGETPLPAEQRKKDDAAVASCALWGARMTPQRRLRALRIAIPREHNVGEKLPARALGDRVAWIIVEGELVQDGTRLGPGALVYPESLVNVGEPAPSPGRDALAVARSDVRALAIRADDFRELCEDDGELGEALLESLAQVIAKRRPRAVVREKGRPVDPRGNTDPHLPAVGSDDLAEAHRPTDPNVRTVDEATARERATTVPDDEPTLLRGQIPTRPSSQAESPIIAPVPPRTSPPQVPSRPSSSPDQGAKRVPPARPASQQPISRPSPPPAPPPSQPSSPPASQSRPPSGPQPVRPTPTPAQAHAAAALPHTPNPVHGLPKAPTVAVTRRLTPPGGTPPPSRTDTPPRPSTASHASTPRVADRSPLGAMSARPESSRGNHVVARNVLKGFAPALTPPSGTPPERASPALPIVSPPGSVRRDAAPSERRELPPPTDPEIETYLELEAELPPESGGDVDLESQRALELALGGALHDEHASVSISIKEDSTRVIETVTETNSQTLTLTVTESSPEDPARQRASTGQDGAAASGTIGDSPEPPHRAKRHNEGDED